MEEEKNSNKESRVFIKVICICILISIPIIAIEIGSSSSNTSTQFDDYDYSYESDYTYTSTSSSDSEYCEAYGCARKKATGSSIYCAIHLEDPTAQTPVAKPKSSSSSSIYSNYHKCEYSGCTNYASGAKYCSKHNQTKCYKSGCNNVEAYVGAGICLDHLTESLNY